MPTHYSGTTQEVLALDTFIKLTRAANALISSSGKLQYPGEPDDQPVWGA